MIVPQKRFDKKDYSKNDLAYQALKNKFSTLYPVLRDEDFGVDVAIYNGKRAFEKGMSPICYVELESKSNWKGLKFPKSFPDVQFLAKKQKFIKMDRPVYWVLFNDSCTNAAMINFKDIISCELDIVTCGSIGSDYFYRIPLKKMMWGIDNLERYLIHDAFQALNQFHQQMIS
ncbi:hypothetical protein NDS46_30005 (plasmid) [Paenibacillus thiaminolyticus]|uniref:hypothetical protein n=1 Tax=Paenibacillus thiaminolyticus TaxID=49283 RepID=UPI00232EBB50|nr:hypothetical protein [Paenibacillus thiaminolyticus]WCF11583.1 hypothetical protein NDS46_30005 [Paenibacillus thiaminolyticus]